MGHQYRALESTVYFYFAANDTSGSGGDGATPLFDVREGGASASAAPLVSGTPTLLTNAAYPAGCYEVAVAATAANGFAADDTFGVFCTLAIDSENPSGFVGSCTLTPLATAAAVAALNDLSAAQVNAEVDTALSDYNGPTRAEATADKDEILAAGGGVGAAQTTTIATLASQTSFTLTAGSADNDAYNGWAALVTDQSSAVQKCIGIISDYVGSTRTVTLKGDPGIFTMATGDTVEIIPAVLAEGLSDQAKVDVNGEVVDAINVDTYAEPGQGTPASTASLAAKINYLYKAWRNRSTQTASEYALYNDDATTVDQKATVSDNGTTADKGEVASGP